MSREADEKMERKAPAHRKGRSRFSDWGKITNYSPDGDAKSAIRAEAGKYPEDALYPLEAAIQNGNTITLSWSDQRNSIRAIMRAPGDDARKVPALAAFHASLVVVLVALTRAYVIDHPNWDEPRDVEFNEDDW